MKYGPGPTLFQYFLRRLARLPAEGPIDPKTVRVSRTMLMAALQCDGAAIDKAIQKLHKMGLEVQTDPQWLAFEDLEDLLEHLPRY